MKISELHSNNVIIYKISDVNAISHYGVKGQLWGKRRYQNKDGSLTEEGIRHRHELMGKDYDLDKQIERMDNATNKLIEMGKRNRKIFKLKNYDKKDFRDTLDDYLNAKKYLSSSKDDRSDLKDTKHFQSNDKLVNKQTAYNAITDVIRDVYPEKQKNPIKKITGLRYNHKAKKDARNLLSIATDLESEGYKLNKKDNKKRAADKEKGKSSDSYFITLKDGTVIRLDNWDESWDILDPDYGIAAANNTREDDMSKRSTILQNVDKNTAYDIMKKAKKKAKKY